MRTLDEVIAELEDAPLGEFSEVEIDYATVEDALHYLKEYKENLGNLYTSMNHHIRKIKELDKDNRPLIWEELKSMIGEPVWMVTPKWKEWLLISEIDRDKAEIYLRDKWGNGVSVNVRNIGYWRAYRKERK